MPSDEGQITQIAGRLAEAMPTPGVPTKASAEALRNTLHYAKRAGILDALSGAISDEADGNPSVESLLDELRGT